MEGVQPAAAEDVRFAFERQVRRGLPPIGQRHAAFRGRRCSPVNPTTRQFFGDLSRVWPVREERQAMADVASRDSLRVQRGARILSRTPVFNAVLRNGISATIVSGGIRSNVIPTDASATLNVRTLPGQAVDAVVRRLGMQAYGVLPFPMNQDDEDRMHGNDERIPLTALEFGTKLIHGAVLRVAR